MSKGFLLLSRNKPNINYVEQAYALALSIKATQKIKSVSLITDDVVPEHYKLVFDNIISIPDADEKSKSVFAAEHRWKFYHLSPYEETIVLDSDMLMLDDISAWWDYCSNFDLAFCSKVTTYKHEPVVDRVHRMAFIENNLTNPYFALHYFKKRDLPLAFYNTLEIVIRNWDEACNKFAPLRKQAMPSMDLASAIAIKMLGIEEEVFNNCSPLEFVHMKPAIQNWPGNVASWQDAVQFNYTTKGEFFVGNIRQHNLFHYVEKNFITPALIQKLEKLNG